MSPEAIVKEARRDTTAILNKRDFFINMHRREILFAKKFPVSFQIEWKSPLTHNQWHIIIACNNKKERENPDVTITPLTRLTEAPASYSPFTT